VTEHLPLDLDLTDERRWEVVLTVVVYASEARRLRVQRLAAMQESLMEMDCTMRSEEAR
jgi:hypothetical protein